MSGFVVPDGGGERLSLGGSTIVVRATAEDTGGAMAIVEEIEPLDTRMHVHEREDEAFFVLEGEHVITVGGVEHHVGPGDLVFGPRGVPHAQRRVVPRTGRLLLVITPPGFEGFFRELAAADAAGTIEREFDAVSARYGITWLTPPAAAPAAR